MDRHVHRNKTARGADGFGAHSSKPPTSQAQLRRDRQQVGVAESLAADAERLFPALRAGVLTPEQLVRQAQHVLKMAKLRTERSRDGEISKEHAGHIITSVRRFAEALDQVGVKVLGLPRVKQSHYVAVMALWEKDPPGEARRVKWILSHMRRLFVVIGRPDVIPRRARNKELLSRHGIAWGTDGAFLVNNHVDWASAGIDVEIICQAMRDPGKRVAAKMMHYWGMSLLEVATWQAVDPDRCSFLHLEGISARRRSREAEFSLDPGFAAKQMTAITEAWNYCRQHDRPSICPSDLSPKQYADQLHMCIRRALAKQFKDQEFTQLTPMTLRDGFFCQVFLDHAGMSLQEARRNPQLVQKDRRLALAWNEAKRQLGVKGADAPGAHKGTPFSSSQSVSIARSLRSISQALAKFHVGNAWVGDVDASAGKCLFVQLLEGAQASALARLQELIQQVVVVKLRVVRVLGARDVPDGAARVMARSVPRLNRSSGPPTDSR